MNGAVVGKNVTWLPVPTPFYPVPRRFGWFDVTNVILREFDVIQRDCLIRRDLMWEPIHVSTKLAIMTPQLTANSRLTYNRVLP